MRLLIAVASAVTIAVGAGASGRHAAAATATEDPAGKTVYDANCRKCHGVIGTPPKTMKAKFPKIATFDAAFFAKRSEDSVITVLMKGKSDDMKSFKDKLTHEQMEQVASYIRTFVKK